MGDSDPTETPIYPMLKSKIRYFLAFMFMITILCYQSPVWGTIGIAEWQSPTPGGNMIGNNDNLPSNTGTAIYRDSTFMGGSTVYVKNIHRYGFYEGAIIGETGNKFFLFDETKKTVQFFANQAQLCSIVKAQGLKFNNTLTFFNGSHHYDYYVIKYSLYFLVPFLVLLIIHCIINRSIPLSLSVNRILKNKFFALQVYALSVCSNVAFINQRTNSSDTIIFDLLVAAILLALIGTPLWFLGQLSLRLFSSVNSISPVFHVRFLTFPIICLKWLIFLGILMIGLSLTIGKMEATWTSIKYFSCSFA